MDHDHSTGSIRGLICHRCNAELKFIDAGTHEKYGYRFTDRHADYLAHPFEEAS